MLPSHFCVLTQAPCFSPPPSFGAPSTSSKFPIIIPMYWLGFLLSFLWPQTVISSLSSLCLKALFFCQGPPPASAPVFYFIPDSFFAGFELVLELIVFSLSISLCIWI